MFEHSELLNDLPPSCILRASPTYHSSIPVITITDLSHKLVLTPLASGTKEASFDIEILHTKACGFCKIEIQSSLSKDNGAAI